ncbi:hypothetical protein OS493_005865 [Desmophyllum pertusum]|uniref:Uncharacterized protein n=1 Tax=Desmophyllum pertusum TaxID=174260 RepID=A0A9W9YFI2_9CNID|nr:hypothetical protein OS493_005865 [Desmophyllum pertusum]
MFLRGDKCRKSRRLIPNASCFVQSVFSLMTSSRHVVVQCEAATLLVELSTAPQVLEAVERCYLKIISQNNVDDTLKKIVHERLKNVQEKITLYDRSRTKHVI